MESVAKRCFFMHYGMKLKKNTEKMHFRGGWGKRFACSMKSLTHLLFYYWRRHSFNNKIIIYIYLFSKVILNHIFYY